MALRDALRVTLDCIEVVILTPTSVEFRMSQAQMSGEGLLLDWRVNGPGGKRWEMGCEAADVVIAQFTTCRT